MLTEREMDTKVCSKCKEVKLLNRFSKDKRNKDGHRYECKVCVKEFSAEYYAANSEKRKEYQVKWTKANSKKCRAYSSKKRAAKLKATPKWLTEEDYKAMDVIYDEADRLTQETGVKYEVDHIHPLRGKLICGLQCPANLQILTMTENRSKGNKFKPYVESELTY